MKVLAMYLPQFHRVKENEEWWGEGFTDWVSTKRAVPLYEGHYQPHEPMNDNYYDLSRKETMEWQADLMHQYGIDGMCIYHYWFKDGRQILEKPAENLLAWQDIDMPYCFCWANETWARTWSGIRERNVWSNLEEPDDRKKNSNGILLEQKYGNQQQWKEHFDYLLPFFRDKRYIRIDEKPVFVIYRPTDISCLEEMLEYWKELAQEAGLSGIYIIGANCDKSLAMNIDAELYHEPIKSRKTLVNSQYINTIYNLSYSQVWDCILQREKGNRKTYYGGFVRYDDTPRRGGEGMVIESESPEKFGHYLTELMAKNAAEGAELVFLNAWNEWGEGMHLEPDKKFGEDFLKRIPEAKKEYKKRISYYGEKVGENKEIGQIKQQRDKFERYLNLLDEWMILREKNICLDRFFVRNGFKKAAVYGHGIFGRHLLQELKESEVEVVCLIDQQKNKIHADVPTYLPTEEFPDCDVIVVTSFYYINEIRKVLQGRDVKLVSIETVIKEC